MTKTRRKRNIPVAPPNTAVVYARYSSSNQREESITAQLRACHDYAKSKGLIVIQEYCDSARTGTNDDRPAFQQMITDSENHAFRFVIVHKLDRFSRNSYDSAIYRRKLQQNGCSVLSALEHTDDSPESGIMESLLTGMAEYYSRNLAREVEKGKKETALQCKHNGGCPPLGYDVDKETKKYTINEFEAKIVKEIFQLYADGNGYKFILQHLNSMGYKTKAGNAFALGSLNNILKNEKYKGIYIYNRKKEVDFDGVRRPRLKPEEEIIRIPDGMPRIIDDVTFAKVQLLLQRNLKRSGGFTAKHTYLLSGLLVCGHCGYAMHGISRWCGRNKYQYTTYKCASRAQKRGCLKKEINKGYLENFVLDNLYDKLFKDVSIEKLTTMLNEYRQTANKENVEKLEQAEQRMKEVEKNISATLELVYSTGISMDTVKTKLEDLEHQKEYLSNYIKELTLSNNLTISETIVSDLVAKSKDFIKTKNLPQCKKFLESYVERVTAYDDHVEIKFKINVPKADNTGLEPLIVTETVENIYRTYKKAI